MRTRFTIIISVSVLITEPKRQQNILWILLRLSWSIRSFI